MKLPVVAALLICLDMRRIFYNAADYPILFAGFKDASGFLPRCARRQSTLLVLLKSYRLIQPEHNVHILDGGTGSSFAEIVK